MNRIPDADLLTVGDPPRLYHLDIPPEDFADQLLIVGDPNRAARITDRPAITLRGRLTDQSDPIDELIIRLQRFRSEEFLGEGVEPTRFFSSIECDYYHRGLRTITGITRKHGDRVTVVTSGMGTPTEEIVLGEIFAAFQIDLLQRLFKESSRRFDIIRIGTSGALQAATKLGTAMITSVALGMDNTGMYSQAPLDPELLKLEDEAHEAVTAATPPSFRFRGKIFPYAAAADDAVVAAIVESAKSLDYPYEVGITASNAGFFHAQGRSVFRNAPTVPDIDHVLAQMGTKVLNMEMEASALLHLCRANGHRAGAVCLAIANRRDNSFDPDYEPNTLRISEIGLEALHRLKQ